MIRRFRSKGSVIAGLWISLAGTAAAHGPGHGHGHRPKYEVRLVDQSDSFGMTYGGSAYIFQGKDLEKANAANAPAERIDLSGATSALCFGEHGREPGAAAHAGDEPR
jgi:hypothetical protein